MESHKNTHAAKSNKNLHAATVALVEYGDYECPHCGHAYPIVKELQEKFGSSLIFTFKNFPLTQSHPHALMAAEAAEAARAQGQFAEMHDALYENQMNLSPRLIAQLAEEIGLDLEKFKTDWSQHIYIPQIEKEMNQGLAQGVQGTPWFFINGVVYQGEISVEEMSAALEAELRLGRRL